MKGWQLGSSDRKMIYWQKLTNEFIDLEIIFMAANVTKQEISSYLAKN